MKTTFTNAEKVSDKFLSLKYIEIKKRFENFDVSGVGFITNRFADVLETIRTSEDDNYEKLKKMIHLEREFETYISSKQFLLDVICFDLSNSCYDKLNRADDDQTDWVLDLLNNRTEVTLVNFSGVSYNQNIYDYLNHKYLPREERFSFAPLVKSLTDKDKAFIWSQTLDKYRTIFREIFKNKKEVVFSSHAPDEDIITISKVALEVYWELFDSSATGDFAISFKANILKAIMNDHQYEDAKLLEFARNSKFWDLLIGFDNFYSENFGASAGAEDSVLNNNQNATQIFPKTTLRKVTVDEFNEISTTKIMCNLDLTEIDLSKFDFSGFIVINCNLNGTNAVLDFSKFNRESPVYYIYGKKVDRFDLSNSCFKGCTINKLTCDILKQYTFSVNTFDEEILKYYGLNFGAIDIEIIDKFYRKILPTPSELGILIGTLGKDIVFSRYKDIAKDSRFAWILTLDELFPNHTLLEICD